MLVTDTSDHLPIMFFLKQTKIIDKNPLIFESRSLTTDKLTIVKNKLYSEDWHGLLNKNDVDEISTCLMIKLVTQWMKLLQLEQSQFRHEEDT